MTTLITRPLGALLRRLPHDVRHALALRFPQLPVALPVTQEATAYDAAFWEGFYREPDPWGLERSDQEFVKYDLTLALAGPGPFAKALEIGCGEGLFTVLLAPLCHDLLAIDISSRAAARAQERCHDHPHVRCVAMRMPVEHPDEEFDLVVASDVLYFWTPDDLRATTRRIEASLRPGGRFVALHYTLDADAITTGDVVHDALTAHLALDHVHSESREFGAGRPYRIDVWAKPVTSPAAG